MLAKGTRMIVITKNKIIAAASLFVLLISCIVSVMLVSKNENITAFSNYKSIIETEIMPANEDDEIRGKKEKTKVSEKILKHFFVLGDKQIKNEPIKTPEPTVQEKKPEEPVLKAESVTIDKGLKISNATPYQVNPHDYLGTPLSFSIDSGSPQVLIMHTHTTESFSEDSYVRGAPDRNLDESKNITAVGEAMANIFEKNGIGVIHDKTVHDYPSYNGAYQKAAATINKNLANHKSIKVVLDVHRDGITRSDGTKVKLVADVNGQKTAQIMLVVGTDVNLPHDNWKENFKLASKIQGKAVEMFPALMRPIDLRQERFNEQLTKGSLIVEVGSNGNTMEEAIRGGEAVAEVVCRVLKGE